MFFQMPRFQDASSVADQMTRLRLKLLEKRVESKKNNMEDREQSAQSARSYNCQVDALHRALRRKQDLLQRLREQHILEDLNRPHTWGGSPRRYQSRFITPLQLVPPAPIALTHIYQPATSRSFLPPLPPAMPQPPHIIHQTLPQHPVTITQQPLQQQPLIAQIPPSQPHPTLRSGSIKEDMLELMLMQNAQMHQIIMHNMMLKAMPPIALSPHGGSHHCIPHSTLVGQDSYQGNYVYVRPDFKTRGITVHHHHHYGFTPTAPQLPPISYPTWLPGVSAVPAAHAEGQIPSLHPTAPVTLPPL